ncbi:hypothetical protein EGW08_008940 [Elysia chlorotica]|uniref:Uncharacterized protein n=1 Tax=Elysia chlorotica TaxID=188477 RepID=A0A3S1BGV4_ELYCH|nr:hypothetical protein EGW08_008940 [Elysia chlorotica]
MVENGKTSTAKEYDSDIAQAMLSNTSLEEESVLLEELSLRFSDDIAQPKILKSRRSAGSSRRKSTRWQNPPCSDLTCPEQIVPQDFRVDTGDQQMCFDGTCKVDLPLRESLESSVDSLLFNTHTNNTFQGDQCETKETACNKINVELEENEYREQAQCEESSSEVCKTKSKRKERRSGKFVPVNYGGNPETSSLETLSGEGSNVMSHSNHIGGDAVTDQLMEDLTVLTNVSDAGDKLVHSLAEATDLSNVANSYEESDLNDSCIGIRQSTRSQRTCKRKSWVLPTANDGSSSLTEKQKRGGRKDVNNKTVSETASSDTAKQDTTLTNTQDEFMVDEALRLLYLNKVYKAPPSMRSWETIKESPTNSKNVFIGKRRLRMLTFEEGLTHTRMVRRHRRATIVNELSQNKVVPISQEEFQCKMKSLSSLLDS